MLLRKLVILLMPAILMGCACKPAEPQPFLNHLLLIWLKEPGNQRHREQLIAASQRLREVPGVLDLDVGQVVQSDRAVVEDSFDVALSLRFRDEQALRAYVEHPLHQQIVKQSLAPLLQRYQVMDYSGLD